MFQDLPADGGFVPDEDDNAPGPPGPLDNTDLENTGGATDMDRSSPSTPGPSGPPGTGLQLSTQAQGQTQGMNPAPSSSSARARPFADFAMSSRGGALHDALWSKYATAHLRACFDNRDQACQLVRSLGPRLQADDREALRSLQHHLNLAPDVSHAALEDEFDFRAAPLHDRAADRVRHL